MSNIALHEILALAESAFAVAAAEMARPRRGRRKPGTAPWPVIARGAVVLLAERHTTASTRDLATAFGRGNRRSVGSAGENLRRDAAKAEEIAILAADVRVRINAIEEQIDHIHERRAEAMERATATGWAGLANVARRGSGRHNAGTRLQVTAAAA